jgi:hypothetical protein
MHAPRLSKTNSHKESTPLTARDRHLFGPGHKRILSLDGGGVRGVISLAFLARMEKLIAEIAGKSVRLGDWFDMIGGTSTGAIIACGLALGYSVSELYDFYGRLGPRVFRRSILRLPGIRARFDSARLNEQLRAILGDRKLDSEDLRTGLCIVTKRLDTSSTWIVMNNPRSRFWESPEDASFIGNRHYPLVNLIRASTAAPNYFDPALIEISPGMKPGLFVDGGVSPHNSPALHLFMVATVEPYGLCWPLGVDNLTVISIGCGSYRPRITLEQLQFPRTFGIALHALVAQMSDAQQLVHMIMSWLGNSLTSWKINSEVGDLGDVPAPFVQPLFNFLRYDLQLETEWLSDELGKCIDPETVSNYRQLDAAENIPLLYQLGAEAAERQVQRSHLELGFRQ